MKPQVRLQGATHLPKAHTEILTPVSLIADTDSMASSLAMAYHLSHRYHQPEKAVALLQIDRKAVDYRPENTMALDFARLNSVHADLLSTFPLVTASPVQVLTATSRSYQLWISFRTIEARWHR